MEFRELRTFCIVSKLGSISAAARFLNLGQPAATKHLKKLEGELGVELLFRGRRPIQLTSAGAALLEVVNPLVEGISALESFTYNLEHTGPVNIAAPSVLITQVLHDSVTGFRRKYPKNLLRLWSRGESDILRMVAEGDVDLGILLTADVPAAFDFSPLLAIEQVLIAAKGHPVNNEGEPTFSSLARWPMVLMSPLSRTRRLLDEAFEKRGLQYDLVVETDSIETIKQYVVGGAGISILPDVTLSAGDAAGLDVSPLNSLFAPDQVGVVTLRGKPLSNTTRNFINELESRPQHNSAQILGEVTPAKTKQH